MATLLEFAGVHYFTKVVKFDWVEFILVEIVGSGKQIFVQHFSLLEMLVGSGEVFSIAEEEPAGGQGGQGGEGGEGGQGGQGGQGQDLKEATEVLLSPR